MTRLHSMHTMLKIFKRYLLKTITAFFTYLSAYNSFKNIISFPDLNVNVKVMLINKTVFELVFVDLIRGVREI